MAPLRQVELDAPNHIFAALLQIFADVLPISLLQRAQVHMLYPVFVDEATQQRFYRLRMTENLLVNAIVRLGAHGGNRVEN